MAGLTTENDTFEMILCPHLCSTRSHLGDSTTEGYLKIAFSEPEPFMTALYNKASFVFSRNGIMDRLSHYSGLVGREVSVLIVLTPGLMMADGSLLCSRIYGMVIFWNGVDLGLA